MRGIDILHQTGSIKSNVTRIDCTQFRQVVLLAEATVDDDDTATPGSMVVVILVISWDEAQSSGPQRRLAGARGLTGGARLDGARCYLPPACIAATVPSRRSVGQITSRHDGKPTSTGRIAMPSPMNRVTRTNYPPEQ